MTKIRLTAAQALIRFLSQQYIFTEDAEAPIFAGVFAIFGHGNVAGMGEALHANRHKLPTYRAHNEQSMAHAAIAFAKAKHRRQMMACTTSIGPGATNMVTAAALAHVNRLPVLLIPGDVFANRAPDPVLQQLESHNDPSLSVNDCFKPVSRYFDRFTRPEQLINSLPAALQTLLDPATCGPVTLAFPQDVQTQSFDYPASLFDKKVHHIRRTPCDFRELETAIEQIKQSKKPLIVAGGGVKYSGACEALRLFAERFHIPIAETQAGKGSINWQSSFSVGGIGVTGSYAANQLAKEADIIVAIGTRLQDFTTASRTLFNANSEHAGSAQTLIQINVAASDAYKHSSLPLVGDALLALEAFESNLDVWKASKQWHTRVNQLNHKWYQLYEQVCAAPASHDILPSDAQVLGAVKRQSQATDVILCAAGGLPGELHKLWRAEDAISYHVEYGFSCMGYEIAGGLGVKIAHPEREVVVVVGDGSYLMMNSELASSVMLGCKIIVVLLDNRGFGCINRLQNATGNTSFNNLFEHCNTSEAGAPKIDFAAHAKAMGANAESVGSVEALESALGRARASSISYLIAIDTDPFESAENGDVWWDVAVPEVSENPSVNEAFLAYQDNRKKQPY